MAVREVLRYPNPVLKREARALDANELELAQRVGRDLVDTMRSFPRCVGVAAPQLDELVRMIVVDVTDHPKATACHGELVLVNPRVVASSGASVAREGCFSFPDLTANVRRATHVTIEATDPAGGDRSIETEGFEARCLLHEMDHLDGVRFLDGVEMERVGGDVDSEPFVYAVDDAVHVVRAGHDHGAVVRTHQAQLPLGMEVLKPPRRAEAGVVDQHIDVAPAPLDRLDHPSAR